MAIRLKPEDVFASSEGMQFIKIISHDMKWDSMFTDMLKTFTDSSMASINTTTVGPNASETAKADGFTKGFADLASKMEEYFKKGDFIANLNNATSDESFFLPMPNILREVHHQMYEDSAYNMEDRMLRNGVDAIRGVVSQLGKYGNSASNMFGNLIDMFDHVARRANITADPNNLLVYAGSAPRTYTFSFNLVPQNQKEALYYSDTIRLLKHHSLGKRETMLDPFNSSIKLNTIRQSKLFTIEFLTSKGTPTQASFDNNYHLQTLFASDVTITKGLSLTNITSTIGDDGLLLYADGSPKVISLSLTFTERKPLWADELSKFYNNALKKRYNI